MKTFLRILFFFLLVTQICIAQWFWQNPLPQGNNLVGLSFVDENTGWIQDNRGAIYKTINAGQSWTKQHNGNYHYRPVIGYGTIIKFLNETTGWLLEWEDYIATRLLKTTDGGNNGCRRTTDKIPAAPFVPCCSSSSVAFFHPLLFLICCCKRGD